jgi:homoprotocatechuate degradation regulator HpaR
MFYLLQHLNFLPTCPNQDHTVRSDLDVSLPTALLRARIAVLRRFRPLLHETNLSEQQWRVLLALAAKEQISVLELARTTDLLGPSLSRILHNLDKRGLTARQVAPTDLRSNLISISSEGRALTNILLPRTETIYEVINSRLGPQQIECLRHLLRQLENCLPD